MQKKLRISSLQKINYQGIKKYLLPLVFITLSLTFFGISVLENRRAYDISQVTESVTHTITRALEELDKQAQEDGLLEDLPEDMHIYRYMNDSLVFWKNTLPLINDRIDSPIHTRRLRRHHHGDIPIQIQEGEYRLLTLGSGWFLARLYPPTKGITTLAALYICDAKSDAVQRQVSKRLQLPRNCYISPIQQDIGYPVSYHGNTLFFINSSPQHSHASLSDSPHKWIGLIFFVLFFIFLLRLYRHFNMWLFTQGALLLCYLVFLSWGQKIDSGSLFTPLIYADGKILSSFGALMGHSLYILLIIISIFIMKERIIEWSCKEDRPHRRIISISALGLGILAAGIYFFICFYSFLHNSSVPIQFVQIGTEYNYLILPNLLFTILFASLILLFVVLSDLIRHVKGSQPHYTNTPRLILFSFLFSLGISIIMGNISTRKEQERTEMWSERLSMGRDVMLEMKLKQIEAGIKKDIQRERKGRRRQRNNQIRDYVNEIFFSDLSTNYEYNITVYDREEQISRENSLDLISGSAISPGSHFIWNCDENGILHYNAAFQYHSGKILFISIESSLGREDKSFRHLLSSNRNDVHTPEIYSYGKYIDQKLVVYKGVFPYSTHLSERSKTMVKKKRRVLRSDGWIHFFNDTEEGEVIIISRKQVGILPILSDIFQRMMIILIIYLIAFRHHNKKPRLNTFARRISSTVIMTITLSLACVVTLSVRYVIDSNIEDSEKVEFEKITTVQTILEQRCKKISSINELRKDNFIEKLEEAAMMTGCDINLFTPQGKLFLSTSPMVFEEMRVGARMDDEAFYNLYHLDHRFHQQRKSFEKRQYSVLYTPIYNRYGEKVCLVAVPIRRNFKLMESAIPHASLLIIISFLLILIIRSLIYRYTEKIFAPLNKIGKRMGNSDISGLEHIEYSGNDEIAALIDAYNHMVDVIKSSAKVMASKERDKAWSEMARQVAHEIKNPLTPIKLDLQRLIRMKEKGNQEWGTRFDELSRIILENIDILTETANDFSSFAKLYTQEPVEFDLDQTLSDQISLFDNKEKIKISYIGLKETMIHGPKPQLIRVFVNLITNSIQSIENAGIEEGRIMVCLRKGQEDGYLEITVEDNGPGVAEENIEKLFTPNFTTKTGGAGIGLAMCRNILQMCDGSIRYSRSFSLGGACFTIELPQK
ncbi:MAG: hypothetical protein II364_02780 [Bacteroidales bacterium]|nr:hypothetical protein [Bacteroidales bacterium]